MTEAIEIEDGAIEIEDVPADVYGYQSLLIRQIRRDGGTQARVGNNEATVQEYTELMRDHLWDFQSRQRPIVLYDGQDFWLADGFHRIEAAQRAGLSDYPVEVLRGTKRDAVLRAAGANSQHGLRRTNDDKRRAVELLLRDEEWRQWSDRKIADVCAVSDPFVGKVRKDLSANGLQMPEARTVERGGSTYQMTPAAPRPAPITPESRDADGPWFKASKSAAHPTAHHWNIRPSARGHYTAACGVVSETLPTTGADAGLCSACARHGDRRELVPIPSSPNLPLPDLSAYGYTARELADGRIAIRTPGNLESEHTHGQLNDLLSFWRSYPPIPADLAEIGVVWRYRSDRMYQVLWGDVIGHTGYTPDECLGNQRAAMERSGALAAPAPIALPSDDTAKQERIRTLASALGMLMVWERDGVILYWPDEVDDLDQLDVLWYDVAIEWLEHDGPGIAASRQQRAATDPGPRPSGASVAAYEANEETDVILLGKAERAIASGDMDAALDLLSQVAVATYRRDQLLPRALPRPIADAIATFAARSYTAVPQSLAGDPYGWTWDLSHPTNGMVPLTTMHLLAQAQNLRQAAPPQASDQAAPEPGTLILPPFLTKDLPSLMESISFVLEMTAKWVPSSREKAAPALGLLRAVGRKALEATE